MELSSEGFCLFLVKQLLLLCRMTGCSSLREVSVRLDCLPYKSFPPLFSPKQVSDNSTDLTRLFFEQESYCHQCVRFCCYLFWVIIQSSAWQLFMKYKYLKSWGHTEYHWHHGWTIHVSVFLDRRAGANKNYRFPFFFNHWSDNLFCRIFYLNASLSEYESQEGTFLPISLS